MHIRNLMILLSLLFAADVPKAAGADATWDILDQPLIIYSSFCTGTEHMYGTQIILYTDPGRNVFVVFQSSIDAVLIRPRISRAGLANGKISFTMPLPMHDRPETYERELTFSGTITKEKIIGAFDEDSIAYAEEREYIRIPNEFVSFEDIPGCKY